MDVITVLLEPTIPVFSSGDVGRYSQRQAEYFIAQQVMWVWWYQYIILWGMVKPLI